jgi:hypothetical protein
MYWGNVVGNGMAEVTFDDPETYRDNVPVDDRGRVVIGKEHSGKRVRIAVEVLDDE